MVSRPDPSLCTFDAFDTHLRPALFTIGSQSFTGWMLMGWGAGLYALLLAWLGKERDVPAADGTVAIRGAAWVSAVAVALGTLMWCVTCIGGLDSGFPVTTGLLLWSLGLMIFGRFTVTPQRAMLVESAGAVVLTIAFIKWLTFDGLALSVMGDRVFLPVLNLFTLNGFLLIATLLAGRVLRQGGRAFLAWSIAAIYFVMLNVESLRAADYWLANMAVEIAGSSDPWIIKNVIISVLWGLLGLAAIVVGFARNMEVVRWTAIALLGATVLKVLVVDMSQVGTVMRVLSFMVVGVVLLLVSLLYSKMAKKILPSAETQSRSTM